MSKLLPPSNVADHGHLNIVRILLGISFLDAYALNKYIMEKGEFLSGPEEPVGSLESLKALSECIKKKVHYTAHIRSKEASSNAFVDFFYHVAYVFSDLLGSRVMVDFQFDVCRPQKRGPNYAADVALAVDPKSLLLDHNVGDDNDTDDDQSGEKWVALYKKVCSNLLHSGKRWFV